MSAGASGASGAPARVVLRPLATPLPLGFLGLCVATLAFSSLQLGWIPPAQSGNVALAVLGLTVPVQLIACVVGFLARDPVAATGMGILAGSWAAVGLATWNSLPGATSPGLGVVLVGAGLAMLVPATAALDKPVAAAVMALSATRFVVTGVAELDGAQAWLTTAGWIGLALAAVSLYAALAFALEDVRHRAVLPLARRGAARSAMAGDPDGQLSDVATEAGVRKQL